MFQRLFSAALAAGFVAGLAAFGLQQVKVVPLIQQAEVFENAAPASPAPHDHGPVAAAGHHHEATSTPGHDHDSHDHGAAAWSPEGIQRLGLTLLADILAGTAFALLLTGAMALAEGRGHAVDARRGLLWGTAGFVAFTVAPALGLPPELPGMESADLVERQIWWAGTAAATVLGLGLLAFRRETWAVAGGVVLMLLPHLIGAPHPEQPAGRIPPELAAEFVTASLATAALFWLVLGGVGGWLFERLGRSGQRSADVPAV